MGTPARGGEAASRVKDRGNKHCNRRTHVRSMARRGGIGRYAKAAAGVAADSVVMRLFPRRHCAARHMCARSGVPEVESCQMTATHCGLQVMWGSDNKVRTDASM